MTLDQLDSLFGSERLRFPGAAKKCLVRLVRKHFVHDPKPRDLGWYEDGCVYLMERVLGMPRANVVAIIRHELGHAADPDIDKAGAEQRADDIAERVTGSRINYDTNHIQTVGVGTYPRPRHLHR